MPGQSEYNSSTNDNSDNNKDFIKEVNIHKNNYFLFVSL